MYLISQQVLFKIQGKLEHSMSQRTTMKTTRESLDRLKKHGKMGDSWDTVLNKVLDRVDEVENV